MSLGHTTTNEIIPDCLPLPGSHRAKILCIDRDPAVADAIESRMSKFPVDVIRARNGMEGYWLAISKNPALIITDLRMTNGHGGEIIESVKENRHTRDIPVIVLTDHDYPGLERHTERMGAKCCLQKPVDQEALASAITDTLALTE